MCYFKSIVEKIRELETHYSASFETITAELEPIRERCSLLLSKDQEIAQHAVESVEQMRGILQAYSELGKDSGVYSKPDFKEVKRCLRALIGFQPESLQFYYENGFDHLPMPIVTASEPSKFKLFNWGLIPPDSKTREEAAAEQLKTLNCVSERMFQTPAYRDAIKNGQRCLIPFTGFYEWRWLDEKGTVRIPYHITFRDGKPRSFAGLYNIWKDPETGEDVNTYTLLTTQANSILEYVHNNKKRMPVIIDHENEKHWLNPDLKKDDVMDLCQPSQDPAMRAYTITKLLTTKDINPNIPQVREPMNYNPAIEAASEFLQAGNKKQAPRGI